MNAPLPTLARLDEPPAPPLPADVEACLRDARQLLRFGAAMDMSGDAIYLIDPVGMRFIDMNLTACDDTGYSRDELLAMRPHELIDVEPEDLAEIYRTVIEHSDESHACITRGRSRDDRERILEIDRRALQTTDGVIIVSTTRDVTVRHRQAMLLAMEHSATRNLAMDGSARQVLHDLLRDVSAAAQWHAAAYYMVSSPQFHTRLMTGWTSFGGSRPMPLDDHEQTTEIPPGGMLGHAATTGTVQWVGDVRSPDFPWRDHLKWRHHTQIDECSRLVIPVMVGGTAIGLMGFSSTLIREPDTALLQTMRVIGDQIGQYLRRKQAEGVVRRSEARFRALTELSSDWYWELDAQHRFSRIERGGAVTSADEMASFAGFTLWNLPASTTSAVELAALQQALLDSRAFRELPFSWRDSRGLRRWVCLSGAPIVDRQGRCTGFRGVSRDITHQRQSEDRILHLASHDALTSLPNRTMFTEALTAMLAAARARNGSAALLFVDLDRFKLINDTLGHDAGDELLVEMAQRLRNCLRSTDIVARLGGDEFVVLVPDIAHESELPAVAHKLLQAASTPTMVAGQECILSASIGIAVFPTDGTDEKSLMKAADIAMYSAKQQGRNVFRFHAATSTAQMLPRLKMETALRRAKDRGDLFLTYQPKQNLRTGRIVGVEALLRWRDAELGLVSPAEFIPVAEEAGIIVPIGKWVLEQACAQSMAWRRAGLPPITMAVNLSPRQFADESLLADIHGALQSTGLDGPGLELEITEGSMIGDVPRAREVLASIKCLGVRIAIDDFGTGYSSLGQLKRFPIDSLKIDRTFVSDIPDDADDMALTASIIAMAQGLRLNVVAEGVETELQREFLVQQGCNEMQGYYFSRPLVANGFEAFWREHLASTFSESGALQSAAG